MIRKAIIPAAGNGTRLFPVTKAIQKEFLPILDQDGTLKPVILILIESAIQAGIEEVGIIIQPQARPFFESFFQQSVSPEIYQKLSPENQAYDQYLQELGQRITLIEQDQVAGFGYAVYCAKQWIGQEPFLLLLGDHLCHSYTAISCIQQILDLYETMQKSLIGLRLIAAEELRHYGCVTGEVLSEKSLLNLTEIREKPSLEYAQQHLKVSSLSSDQFLSMFGIYVLESDIFELLGKNIENEQRERGEFQLTSALETLRREQGIFGYLVDGKCFDTGLPHLYWQTFKEYFEI